MNKKRALEIIDSHKKALDITYTSKCKCELLGAVYYCFGQILCQRCNSLVDMERAKDFIDFNTDVDRLG